MTEQGGRKFKRAEREWFQTLPKKSYAVIRFDGKNFSTFTKRFARPFDPDFMAAMDATALAITKKIPGAVLGYVQSDEISVIFSDLQNENSDMWFGGRVQKMISLGSAMVSVAFGRAASGYLSDSEFPPIFDARVHPLDGLADAREYVEWRRDDAKKNSITMAVSTMRSHKQLLGMDTPQRRQVLVGTELEFLPEGFHKGRIITPTTVQASTDHLDPELRKRHNIPDAVERTVLQLLPATRENLDAALPASE